MRDITFLNREDLDFIQQKTEEFRLSFQDQRKLEIIASDLRRWDEGSIRKVWQDPSNPALKGKDRKKHALKKVKAYWENLKITPKDYADFSAGYTVEIAGSRISDESPDSPIMGRCPVASEKTRCCNLQTLDAVINCGFDCSYCSIQTFYHTDEILFHKDLSTKLQKISNELEPEHRYHIGTGQSSDSLMWGNHAGMMDSLFEFALRNPNVLLELKSKSSNIDYLLNHDIPANILTTWSLNPPVIIRNEEHRTSSLEERLDAAKRIAAKGGLIGFHFHPMIIYKNWKHDYTELFSRIQTEFSTEDITHISFGTLTFIKPVIKELRKRELKSKILQMPMEEIAGKLSYPYELKKDMFEFAYNSFKHWHNDVFFYLCMEDIRLWQPVFGKEYNTNEEFETDMINSYFKKVNNRWKKPY